MNSGNLEQRALGVLRELLAIDDREQRRTEAEQVCSDQPELLAIVLALLDADAASDPALDQPVAIMRDLESADDGDLLHVLLGPYRILERIGRGGMGTVYRAEREHAEFRQQVAIKVLRRGLDSDDILSRFLRERRILASLSHPNLTRLIDGGRTEDGRPWLAMEFVEGCTITDWCDERRLDPRARIALLLDVADAVQHAHERLIVHRDIKPGNVLVDAQGHVHLLDFGIAKLVAGDGQSELDLTRLSDVGRPGLFTPEYAAPEQLTGGTIRAATDVYALGVLLFELLTGRLPHVFEHRDWRSIQTRLLNSAPPRLAQAITEPGTGKDLPPEQRLQRRAITLSAFRRLVRGDLERILVKSMAKEPERRYATVHAFADDLRRFLAGQPVAVAGGAWRYRLRKFVARNRTGVALGTLSFVLLVTGVSGIVWQWQEAQQQALMAQAEAHRANAVRDYLTLMFREARSDSRLSGQVTAREVLDRSAGRIEKEFAGDPALRQSVLATMAELYIHLQDYQGARPLLERFNVLEDGSSPIHVRVTALDDLAVVDLRQGHAGTALSTADAALALIDEHPTPEVERLRARVLITRGQIRRALGQLEPAISDLEQALHLTQLSEGMQARQTAVARNSLGLAYMIAGRPSDALRELEATLASFDALDLGESGDALNVLSNLGALKLMRGNIDQAEVLLKRALQLQRSLVGDSAGLAATMLNHGRVLLFRNRLEDARNQMLAARAMIEQFTAADSLDMAGAELALADAALMSGDANQASGHADAALTIMQRLLPPAHPAIGRALTVQAQVQQLRADPGAALNLLESAMAILEPAGPGSGGHLARALCLRAELHLTQARHRDAAGDAGRCLALRADYADPLSWEIAQASLLLATSQRPTDDSPAVRQRLHEARQTLVHELGARHTITRHLSDLVRTTETHATPSSGR